MANDTRNPIDVLRDNIITGANPAGKRSTVSAGSSSGSGATGSFSLQFRTPEGERRKWFKWGRHNFDSEDVVFW